MLRKRNFQIALLISITFLLPVIGQSQTYNKPGATAAPFLKIGVSARGEAMGQTIVAVVDDATSAFYNPAGLMNIQKHSLVAGKTSLPADVGLSFLSYGMKISYNETIAFSVLSLRTDEMVIRTVLQPEGTGESFVVADYAFGISYARGLTDKLKLGLTTRYLWMNLVSGIFTKHSWSADLGIQYQTQLGGIFKGLELGVAVTNFGPQVTFINESFGLPLRYTVGVAKPYDFSFGNKLILAINWTKYIDEQQKAQVGFENCFRDVLWLRGGYRFASDSETWSGGVGIAKTISNRELKLDYAYAAFGILGEQHRLTIGINF